ncbi:hypothetical protein BH23BAC1_BH23BAC1_04980 [soil metagenome]
MKINNIINNNLLIISAVGLFTFSGCADRAITQQDVQDNVEEAREATEDANVKTQESIESREQLFEAQREAQLQELEERNTAIDNRIQELRDIAQDSENERARSQIESAITEMQRERNTVNAEMERVRNLEAEDWSDSYESINTAISNIEQEIDRVSQSLEHTEDQ